MLDPIEVLLHAQRYIRNQNEGDAALWLIDSLICSFETEPENWKEQKSGWWV